MTGTPASRLEKLLRRQFARAAPEQADDGDIGAPDASELTLAAVLVPVVLRQNGPTVLLTQRTTHLRDHAGQISFPGGRREDSDATDEFTALREAQEEVGLAPDSVEILGRLPRYRTGTGFLVTPVVGLVSPPLDLKLDDFEVAEVFEPPLDFLLDTSNHQRRNMLVAGKSREFWAVPWEGYYIWGATAGILVGLSRFLRCEETA